MKRNSPSRCTVSPKRTPPSWVRTDEETGQTIISGMGELHLEILVDRLLREFRVDAAVGKPQVAYRETIRRAVEKVSYKHVKQTGGKGQYGHVVIDLEPTGPGGGYEFVDKISGGRIPREYIPSVDAGIEEALEQGILAGYPLVDVRAILQDGSYHDVDSSEMAFKIAGSIAFQEAARKAGVKLLEPVMDVEVTTPEDYMGDVIGDLNSRRGKVEGMTQRGNSQVIKAQVPDVGDVWLRHGPEVKDPGSCHLFDAIQFVSGRPRIHRHRNRGDSSGRGVEVSKTRIKRGKGAEDG